MLLASSTMQQSLMDLTSVDLANIHVDQQSFEAFKSNGLLVVFFRQLTLWRAPEKPAAPCASGRSRHAAFHDIAFSVSNAGSI